MKFFVISDIHSFYDEMIKALNESGYDKNNPNHYLICCGDLLDRGDKSLECLKFINSIPKERKTLIMGNHEILLDEALNRGEFLAHDFHNGTVKTCLQIAHFNLDDFEENDGYKKVATHPELVKYFDSLVGYCEVGDYVFAHSTLPLDWDTDMDVWEHATFANPFIHNKDFKEVHGKTIVFGHWHTSYAHHQFGDAPSEWNEGACFDIYKDPKGNFIGIDGCTAFSHKVNVLTFEV